MIKLLAVGLGGFFGAISRYQLSLWVQKHFAGVFPFGTLAVNVLGCLIIGVLMTLVELRQSFSPEWRLILITGFLGSLTTFSTFGFDTFKLLESGRMGHGLVNIAANMLLGLAAVTAGRLMVRALVA